MKHLPLFLKLSYNVSSKTVPFVWEFGLGYLPSVGGGGWWSTLSNKNTLTISNIILFRPWQITDRGFDRFNPFPPKYSMEIRLSHSKSDCPPCSQSSDYLCLSAPLRVQSFSNRVREIEIHTQWHLFNISNLRQFCFYIYIFFFFFSFKTKFYICLNLWSNKVERKWHCHRQCNVLILT